MHSSWEYGWLPRGGQPSNSGSRGKYQSHGQGTNCQTQPLVRHLRNGVLRKLGKLRDEARSLSWEKQSLWLWEACVVLANVNRLFLSTRKHHLVQVNKDKTQVRLGLGARQGICGMLPLTWSRRAFLNSHWLGQIDPNCPSKELRLILKGLKI